MDSVPTVMVSSTFFDLEQVRNDLRLFLRDQLGYSPLLSEFSSFPVDPDVDTIENCRRRVENNADVLVLVVGGRYGSLDRSSDRSITNLEYLVARRKGIPIYVFVRKRVLEILPVWQKNPEGDFSGVVDTSRLFEFIHELREEHRAWTFPFETAQDILDVLRSQFAHLMAEGLQIRLRLAGGGIPAFLGDASPAVLRIALEQPQFWEFRLLARCWCDEVDALSGSLREHQVGLRSGPAERVEILEIPGWAMARLDELKSLAADTNSLINDELQSAIGAPGEPGNAEHTVWVAKQLGVKLRDALRRSGEVRRASIPAEAEELRKVLLEFPEDMIERFQQFPRTLLHEIDEAIEALGRGEEDVKITMTFTLDAPDLEGFERALVRYARESGLGFAL